MVIQTFTAIADVAIETATATDGNGIDVTRNDSIRQASGKGVKPAGVIN